MPPPAPRRGFTLIELMIVVAILGILASIGIPKFGQLIAKSQESTIKGHLGAIRSALAIYYSETEGGYPSDNLSSLVSKFILEIPGITLPKTTNSPGHGGVNSGVQTGDIPAAVDDVAGGRGWLFDNTRGDGTWGFVVVNCSHQDLRAGEPWTSF